MKFPAEPLQDRVEVPDPVTLVGLRLQARPAGETVTDRLTVPENPFTGVMVMVEVPVAPALMVTLVGLSVMVKS